MLPTMADTPFIEVILPLRLEWDPWYSLPEAAVGERVSVPMAGREYVGVVSRVNAVPQEGIHILPAARTELPPVHPREIAFWSAIADYYLCSVGEVYKAAYPEILRGNKDKELPEKNVRQADNKPLSPARQAALEQILEALSRRKTVLLQGGTGRTELYLELARKTLEEGKSVLWLVPEIALSRQLEKRIRSVFPGLLTYHSGQTVARRKAVASAVRGGEPTLVLGTRSALFLPHHELGLVIVDGEQDSSYKQEAPAPRYHAREAAILLARIQEAGIVLGSVTPSLESLYNAENGLFTKVELKEDSSKVPIHLINTAAEIRKNGMAGSFSLKLLEAMRQKLDAHEPVLLICRSKEAVDPSREELSGIFPGQDVEWATPASFKTLPSASFSLIAILQADTLLSKEDFRSDERTLQILHQLAGRCREDGELLIQTMEAGHPVFKAFQQGLDALAFLPERQQAGYPPCSRSIHLQVKDNNAKRADFLARELARSLPAELQAIGPYAPAQEMAGKAPVRLIGLMLPRDKALHRRKAALAAAVSAFEKERKYFGHIAIDVDPL